MTDPPVDAQAVAGARVKRGGPAGEVLRQALEVLAALGIPLEKETNRRRDRVAGAFLAVADVSTPGAWRLAKDIGAGRSVKTRDIIAWENEHLGEHISAGSYDDIRRQDLKLLLLAGVVVSTAKDAARNDPTRGYAISPEHAPLIRTYGEPDWRERVAEFMRGRKDLGQELARPRETARVEVTLPGGRPLTFSPGEHNELQKAVIEEFLPRFGFGAEVLYVGDTAKKFLLRQDDRLRRLGFFELSHGELPDIVAYSKAKNWMFLIEAVHSTGPVSETRLLKLKELTRDCTASLIFVTAFPDAATFRKFSHDIAWETEVWIASRPDHLVHFNGDKFLGPYVAPG